MPGAYPRTTRYNPPTTSTSTGNPATIAQRIIESCSAAMGLMIAIELVRDRATKEPAPDVLLRVQDEAKARGLIIGRGGLHGNVIRICPPLIVSERDADDAVRVLDDAFSTATTA